MTKDIVDEHNTGTRERILDAAESLFSLNGFDETSMRDITKLAKVNLAAVNYHFGTKVDLMQEVFVRCLEPIANNLDDNLDKWLAISNDHSASLTKFFTTIIAAALSHERRKRGGGAIFMRLLSRIYSESQIGLRKALVHRYQGVLVKCVKFLRMTTPDLPLIDMFYRIHFALGSLAFALAGEKELSALSRRIYQEDSDDKQLLQRLASFIVAGMHVEKGVC